MADEPSKPRPLEYRTTGYVHDRTDDLRIKRAEAQRIIARHLRDSKHLPAEANELARKIVDGLVANMPSGVRPGMRGFRMISSHPPDDARQKIAAAFRAIRLQESSDNLLAIDVWKVVYDEGYAIPDEVVV